MKKLVPVYQPTFKVTLFKTIKRDTIEGSVPVSVRYGSNDAVIDLTPWFTDVSSITTSKSCREPAGGFALQVADRPYDADGGSDSLYGVVEPMDIIVIRFQHQANYRSTPPVVMRGFVSAVSRRDAIGPDGRPARSVVIQGQDYGKLWQMLQIFYGPGYVIGQDIVSAYAMFERFGSGFKIGQKGSEFLTETVQKILNPYIKQIIAGNSINPAALTLSIGKTVGTTSISGTQNTEGPLSDLLMRFLDVGIWNELFLAEDDKTVYCVYRPNPAMDVKGNMIDPGSPAPVKFDPNDIDVTRLVYYEIFDADIVSIDVGRTDSNVANYYWVRAPRFEIVSDIYRKQAGATSAEKKTIDLTDYINSKGELYGIRKMEVGTEMGGEDVTNHSSGLPAAEQAKRDTSMMNWIANRRQILLEQNRDNVLLETGTIVIVGNENIRPGNFAKVRRGAFTAMYYIEKVDHQLTPFNRFVSVLHVDRGMGFVERVKSNGGPDSPYYAELTGS